MKCINPMRCFFTTIMCSLIVMFVVSSPSSAADEKAVSPKIKQELERLRAVGKQKGWTFEVGYSKVLEVPELNRTGLIVPRDWRHNAQFVTPALSALPKKFDWRTEKPGGLTPIQNQGSCGSCWAFASAASFADMIWIRDGVKKDLSEQYLVSCNKDGYSCGGGWWIHHMHEQFGMVPESNFPYEAEDVSCPQNLPHENKLDSWSFLGDVLETQPTVEQLKQAIYTYGPISVAVAATGSFQAYSSGVFNDCEDVEINHAVNLVGWNDEEDGKAGYWIMRNSWGADWGENGFMKIKYECNSIGFAASVAAYKASCQPQPKAAVGPDVTIKEGKSVKIGVPSNISQAYEWSPSEGLDRTDIAQPTASPTSDTVYTLVTKNKCGKAMNTVRVTVVSGDGDDE